MSEDISQNQALTLLMLPEEIIYYILSYVTIKKYLALVCRELYDIVCSIETDRDCIIFVEKIYADEVLFLSIVNTRRTFKNLTIDLINCKKLETTDKLISVLQIHGNNIEKLIFWNSRQFECSMMDESQLIDILSMLPNLVELQLLNICVTFCEDQQSQSDLLDMCKLEKLVLNDCRLQRSYVLNLIPEGVIKQLTFYIEPENLEGYQEFFDRQYNINQLEIFENAEINYDHLQLDKIKMSSDIDVVGMIRKQPNLKYIDFAIKTVEDNVLDEITHLENLETLKLNVDCITTAGFRKLDKMKKLKELYVEGYGICDHGPLMELSSQRCQKIEKLTLVFPGTKIKSYIVTQFGINYKLLKHIELVNPSIGIIIAFLETFPLLESISVQFQSIQEAPSDVLDVTFIRHENLKKLVIGRGVYKNYTDDENARASINLLKSCPNIEHLMISNLNVFRNDDLSSIFTNLRRLTHLSLTVDDFTFDVGTIFIILTYGRKLRYLHFDGIKINFSAEILANAFDDLFSCVKLCESHWGNPALILKKHGESDWNVSLTGHF